MLVMVIKCNTEGAVLVMVVVVLVGVQALGGDSEYTCFLPG